METTFILSLTVLSFALSFCIVTLKAIMDTWHQRRGRSHVHYLSLAIFTTAYLVIVLFTVKPTFLQTGAFLFALMGVMQWTFDPIHNHIMRKRLNYVNLSGESWYDRHFYWTKSTWVGRIVYGGIPALMSVICMTNSAKHIGIDLDLTSYGVAIFAMASLLILWAILGQNKVFKRFVYNK